MYEFSALKYMMAWSIDEMEKEREALGPDPWAYGLEANRHILETLVQYTHEQGLISKSSKSIRYLPRARWRNSRSKRSRINRSTRLSMADEKPQAFEETKWWIDRGRRSRSAKKSADAGQEASSRNGPTSCCENYNQDRSGEKSRRYQHQNFQGARRVDLASGDITPSKSASTRRTSWRRSKAALPLPPGARGIVIDAGYSVRVMITGEPVGERYVDINFADAPSLDYWVKGQLVEERVFSNVGEALKRIRAELPRYLTPLKSLVAAASLRRAGAATPDAQLPVLKPGR